MNILITGGVGYIGSHTCVELISSGDEVIIFDNLSNSSEIVLKRIKKITGKEPTFINGDIRNKSILVKALRSYKIEAVIHFAGLKSVSESIQQPLEYFDNNITGSLSLFEAMNEVNIRNLIFSSSAAVYGTPKKVPISEESRLISTNPYGRSKIIVEEILNDLVHSDSTWNVIVLRYFNPIGAHKSGLIGEDPSDIPNNLMPYLNQVAIGIRKELKVYGDNYPTKDGTGVRDFIHVVDLAKGHLAAIRGLKNNKKLSVYNLGTGKGNSVMEVIHAYEKACCKKIPFSIVERRNGDVAECFADPSLAKHQLGWVAGYDLDDMCKDSWRWQSNNPKGYSS